MIRIFASALILTFFVAVSANGNSIETQDASQTTDAPPSVPMTAEMVKRGDGSWVIVKLSATDDLESKQAALEDHPDLQATFERYRRALAGGNMTQLASVWIMNPAERHQMNRFADSDHRISISISDASFVVEGDRATVSFMQNRKRAVTSAPRTRELSRRGMAAYDPAGAWDRITRR